jgi:hypothetical protein
LILGDEQSGFADAHRGDGKRFVVRADEKLTAFGGCDAIYGRGGGGVRKGLGVGVGLRTS